FDPWSGGKFEDALRAEGRDWPSRAHSMAGVCRLENVRILVERALKEGVPGDLIETGVWRGGCCILMRGLLAAHGVTDRRVFVADSFEGLPPPQADKYAADKGDRHHTFEELKVSVDDVRLNFERYGLLDEQVTFLKGWFKDTLPTLDRGQRFAVIRLDGDMYGSTIDALTHLYPKLSPGGFCIIDDYGAVPACQQAVTDYCKGIDFEPDLNRVDWTGAWWQKPAA
ncbi:MAG: TylF/MycF/NovP-related O-methyltransferase, partial [Pseudomonadota bacterium]